MNKVQNAVSQAFSGTFTYSYVTGRMLTRTDTSGTTVFEWDGFNCIREAAPESGSAVYNTAHYSGSDDYANSGAGQCVIANGMMFELLRDYAPYATVPDALSSTRLVLDQNGAVTSTLNYDAYGNALPSSSDSLPGSMPYTFVGGLGCRADSGSGLVYCRQRWLQPNLQRFISRDPLGSRVSPNLYSYADDNPVRAIDPLGMCPPRNSQEWVQQNLWPLGLTWTGQGIASEGADDISVSVIFTATSIATSAIGGLAQGGTAAAGTTTASDVSAAEVGSDAGLAAGGGDLTTVGRWMGQSEQDAMIASGEVQESTINGVTHVNTPPDPMQWIRQTSGTNYVQFDVPSAVVQNGGFIYRPNSFAAQLYNITQMPSATNIIQTVSKWPQ